jgi:hypothetical protein
LKILRISGTQRKSTRVAKRGMVGPPECLADPHTFRTHFNKQEPPTESGHGTQCECYQWPERESNPRHADFEGVSDGTIKDRWELLRVFQE